MVGQSDEISFYSGNISEKITTDMVNCALTMRREIPKVPVLILAKLKIIRKDNLDKR